jgi:hypothetical protein
VSLTYDQGMTTESDRDHLITDDDDAVPNADKLDPEGAPSRISVYERPQRQFSPWVLLIVVVLLLIAAYFAYQFFV